jgi:hypothetical protein
MELTATIVLTQPLVVPQDAHRVPVQPVPLARPVQLLLKIFVFRPILVTRTVKLALATQISVRLATMGFFTAQPLIIAWRVRIYAQHVHNTAIAHLAVQSDIM